MIDEIVYTAVGYGKILTSTDSKITVALNWGGTGYFNRESVRTSVPILIKSFSSDKKQLEFDWPVVKPFKDLYAQVSSSLSLPPHIYIILIYPRGTLKTVLSEDTPMSLSLKPYSKFVAMSQVKRQKFNWNEGKKGENLLLSNRKRTLQKQSDEYFETALGSLRLEKGSYYWEISVDCFVDEEDFFMGVALEAITLNARPCDTGMFWGFLGSGAVKTAPERDFEEYGEVIRNGDVIGVSLEYSEGLGTLSFSKNGADFGVAFTDVPPNVYPAICLLYTKAQATLGFK